MSSLEPCFDRNERLHSAIIPDRGQVAAEPGNYYSAEAEVVSTELMASGVPFGLKREPGPPGRSSQLERLHAMEVGQGLGGKDRADH